MFCLSYYQADSCLKNDYFILIGCSNKYEPQSEKGGVLSTGRYIHRAVFKPHPILLCNGMRNISEFFTIM